MGLFPLKPEAHFSFSFRKWHRTELFLKNHIVFAACLFAFSPMSRHFCYHPISLVENSSVLCKHFISGQSRDPEAIYIRRCTKNPLAFTETLRQELELFVGLYWAEPLRARSPRPWRFSLSSGPLNV